MNTKALTSTTSSRTRRALLAAVGSVIAFVVSVPAAGYQSPHTKPGGPPVPYVDDGACPFEGCLYREWTARGRVVIRIAPNAGAQVAFTVGKGEKVTAVTGFVTTLEAGRVEFRKAVDLETARGRLHVEPGDVLFLLTYLGEGHTKAWFHGRMYDWVDGSMAFFNALCDMEPRVPCDGKITEKPRSVWWVKVRNNRGLTGWTNHPEEFDGKDALGDAHERSALSSSATALATGFASTRPAPNTSRRLIRPE